MTNKEPTDESKPPSVLRSAFPPGMVAWILAVLAGVVAPLFLEQFVGEQLGALSLLPETAESGLPTTEEERNAVLTLFGLFSCYILILSYQLYAFVTTRRALNLLPLPLTFILPAFIWLVLPYFI